MPRNNRLETELIKQIRTFLEGKNVLTWKINVGSSILRDGRLFKTGVERGFPDIFGITNKGKSLFIEVKRPDAKASVYQIKFLVKVLKNNARAGIACDLNDVKRILRGRVGNISKFLNFTGYTSSDNAQLLEDVFKVLAERKEKI